ncbi:aminoglycoside phosphotransferase family protein [Nonomuraea wenchangensis]|uniref:Ser/Thr protein kinase RdoA involved in Cpx stress response, MazF antagonist n=1 Tax=Nonomuraea wenchangensis TaxID=568860 RepID=A0A1I0LCZ0_9ACTN|nr:aminoglycoside phosphotransferase family protein [Nonomuraea wenchangensis]SEU37989.1 Ser/Thr protein kinase RdoA involved in Cpx stress response, MazF antagonist [Nonomuraea wenchangensis]
MSHPPAVGGSRVPWSRVPQEVRAAVEEFLGGRVAEARTQEGGFSPAAAVRVRTEHGRRAFVKTVGPEPNPDTPHIYRAELRIAAALPESAPAPRLLTGFEVAGWVTLVFEDVEGEHPELPWRRDQLDLVLEALARMSRALTPSPVADAPTVAEIFGDSFHGWRRLTGEDTAGLDPWALRHLGELAELEAGWESAAAGDSLAHGDLRADNILLAGERVFVVDWPWACRAAPWFDLLCMLPSVGMQGGPPPWELFADAEPAVVAAVAGYLARQSRQPAPPGLATVREFQRAQGVVALEWLRRRTGWA